VKSFKNVKNQETKWLLWIILVRENHPRTSSINVKQAYWLLLIIHVRENHPRTSRIIKLKQTYWLFMVNSNEESVIQSVRTKRICFSTFHIIGHSINLIHQYFQTIYSFKLSCAIRQATPISPTYQTQAFHIFFCENKKVSFYFFYNKSWIVRNNWSNMPSKKYGIINFVDMTN
jgi:hypothetical protein